MGTNIQETYEQPKATTVFWEDNFDSYDDGSSMHGQGGWKGWDNDPTYTAYVSSDYSTSTPHSVNIEANADLVHEFDGCTSGQWTFTAWQYIPTDFLGQSYFILLSSYEDGMGQDNLWSCQIRFDSDLEIVEAEHGGPNLPLITGEWIELRVEIDLDTDWYEFYYDDDLLEEKEWTAGPNNDYTSILNIDAVDLFANLASPVYYDDLSLVGESTSADLECEGDLNWADIETGSTQTGSFTVENIGAAGTELNWEITDYPSWGTWTFTPSSGTGLTPEDGAQTIQVEVVAPSETETEFTGSVRIVNTNNTADYCTIDAFLSTPMSDSYPMLEKLAERFPIFARILDIIF
jgi:hypothetical protein